MKRNIIAFCIFCLCTGSLAACNDFDNPAIPDDEAPEVTPAPVPPAIDPSWNLVQMPDEGGQNPPASSSTRTRKYDALPYPYAGLERRRRRAHHGTARRPCLLVVQRQFLRRGGRQDPRPGQLQLPAQQPDDPERGDDRLRTGERRRPGMAGRLRADGQPLGRTLLPGPHPHPPSESLPLRCRDPERRNRPGLLLLGRRCRRI